MLKLSKKSKIRQDLLHSLAVIRINPSTIDGTEKVVEPSLLDFYPESAKDKSGQLTQDFLYFQNLAAISFQEDLNEVN